MRRFNGPLGNVVTFGLASPMLAILLAILAAPMTTLDEPLSAASSEGCEGGGFTLTLGDGSAVSADGDELEATLPASRLGAVIAVRGKYVEFNIVTDTFGITDYAFTGAPNPLDMTGGIRTPVFASKTPDHRGRVLTGGAELELDEEELNIERSGPGISMKIQAKDCAQGGVFQMEPEREDGTPTIITHVLAGSDGDQLTAFYFDNPNFRAREGDLVPYKDILIPVPTRVNIANDFSRKFVGRDSPQVAERIPQGCENQFLNRQGQPVIVDHCGGVSVWSVASGGRMGAVFGEDAIEVAPPATECTRKCQAQNRVRGRSVKLGFPFPVPNDSRLEPRFPAGVPE